MRRLEALRVEGIKKRGRPRLRWEDCVKRDLAGVGGEDESEGWGEETGGGDDSEMGSGVGKILVKLS